MVTDPLTASLQELLPEGIQLFDLKPEVWEQATGSDSVSSAPEDGKPLLYGALDTRSGVPVERFVRFVPLRGVAWNDKFSDRLRRILREPFPNVLQPLEAGFSDDGAWAWMIGDRQVWPPFALGDDSRISGLPDEAVIRLLRQLLDGLAALHGAGLAHGDISTDNVVFHPADGPQSQIWITGLELGPLASWSGGGLMKPKSHLYYPPDWNGGIGQPSPSADLYAAGLVACQLLLGESGAPDKFDGKARAVDIRRELRQKIKPASASIQNIVSDWLKRIVGYLLGPRTPRQVLSSALNRLLHPDVQQRPRDGRQALALLDDGAALPRRVFSVLLVVVVFVFIFVIPPAIQRRLTRTEEQLAAIERRVNDSIQRIDTGNQVVADLAAKSNDFDTRMQTMDASLHERLRASDVRLSGVDVSLNAISKKLQVERTTDSKPTPTDRAMQAWNKAFNWGELRQGNVASVLAAIEAQKADSSVQNELRRWAKLWQGEHARAATWLSGDPITEKGQNRSKLEAYLEAAARVPDDMERRESKAWQAFDERLTRLEEAAKTWRNWANQDGWTWEDVGKAVEAQGISAEKEILRNWQDGLKESEFQLRFLSGAAPAGYGVTRQIQVWTAVSNLIGPVHDWAAETAENYSAREPSERQIPFTWTPGSSIGIRLYGERTMWRSYFRPTLAQIEFTGPLALWRAANLGSLNVNGFVLNFEIVAKKGATRFPGPPLDSRMARTGRQSLKQ